MVAIERNGRTRPFPFVYQLNRGTAIWDVGQGIGECRVDGGPAAKRNVCRLMSSLASSFYFMAFQTPFPSKTAKHLGNANVFSLVRSCTEESTKTALGRLAFEQMCSNAIIPSRCCTTFYKAQSIHVFFWPSVLVHSMWIERSRCRTERLFLLALYRRAVL